jgi:hypothetical protein
MVGWLGGTTTTTKVFVIVMLVVGTPRPVGVLGEVSDNGFFDPFVHDAGEEEGSQSRDSRTRSESFHEKFTDEGDKAVDEVQMIGKTPLLAKQLAIVTMLDSHAAPEGPESSEEHLLEAAEAVSLQAWAQPGGRGRHDTGPSHNGLNGSKRPWGHRRRSSLSKTLVVHSGINNPPPPTSGGDPPVQFTPHRLSHAYAGEVHVEFGLLPPFEDKVSVAQISSTASNLEWAAYDLVLASSRRVRCDLWTVPDSLAQDFIKSNCEVCIVEWNGDAERAKKLLQVCQDATRSEDVVVALRGAAGKKLMMKNTTTSRAVCVVDTKPSSLDVLVCRACINLAKKRNDDVVANSLMAHIKKGGACAIM